MVEQADGTILMRFTKDLGRAQGRQGERSGAQHQEHPIRAGSGGAPVFDPNETRQTKTQAHHHFVPVKHHRFSQISGLL